MWLLIPLLVLGAVAIAAARSRDVVAPPPLALPPPPGPIAVLGEFVRIGQMPPPPVILCAIAEAEAIGRVDIASGIVRLFIAPVVYQHQQLMQARPPQPQPYERGTCAPRLSCSPRAEVDAPVATPMATAPAKILSDEEIRAMLNADPTGFFAMVTRGGPMPVIDVPVMESPPQPMPAPQQAPSPQQEVSHAMAPGSPIGGVSDDAWRSFVALLEREDPTFSSSRHVGQYRQRRERLAELGVDPGQVLGSAHAQRAALDIDLADAHQHAAQGGLLAEHLGRTIAVPGHGEPACITLSGLLGVIQCAGLEGAVGWLERPGDRSRFPHTTQAFSRSNGVF